MLSSTVTLARCLAVLLGKLLGAQLGLGICLAAPWAVLVLAVLVALVEDADNLALVLLAHLLLDVFLAPFNHHCLEQIELDMDILELSSDVLDETAGIFWRMLRPPSRPILAG